MTKDARQNKERKKREKMMLRCVRNCECLVCVRKDTMRKRMKNGDRELLKQML